MSTIRTRPPRARASPSRSLSPTTTRRRPRTWRTYFDAPYHLPALSLTTYNLGQAGYQPSLAWSGEAENDIEMIHSIAPLAHIDLVEADDGGLQELMEADQYAAKLPGVVVVSDSWGVPEFATENQLDRYISAPDVTFVAATGDNGVMNFPAASLDSSPWAAPWSAAKARWLGVTPAQECASSIPAARDPTSAMAVNSANFTGTSVSAPLFAGLVGIADALRVQNGLSALSTRRSEIPA